MASPNFERLNKLIREAGADWIAGETPFSKFHGTKRRSGFLGLAMTPELAFSSLQAARKSEQSGTKAANALLPPTIDWRNYKSKNWVTPIRDQGSCGSCVAFATCATLESRTLISQNKPSVNFDLSEAHLFYCGTPNSCDLGWQPAFALNFAQTVGVGLESSFPYTPGNQACRQVTPAVKIHHASVAATTIARKTALLDGPVVASMAVYDDFFHYKSGVYRHVSGNLVGYHAICVIGYDDSQGCWLAKNSWGTSWGDSGFFAIRYGECGIDTQFPFNFPDRVTVMPGVAV